MTSSRPVALVTGSATGVGRACAQMLATRGFDLVVNYSRSKTEAEETVHHVRAAGADALLVACDVSDDQAVREMLERVRDRWKRLDVLVNNAACTQFIDHRQLDDLTEEVWDQILAVNVKGPYFVCRAAVPLLRQSDRAAIVNISSVAGLNGVGSSIAYCASKGALNTMTRSLARALAPTIRVNAVCPGPIDTRWLRRVKTEAQLTALVANYPIPRACQPDDVAEAVCYLACQTTMTTGQCLALDGGHTV